MSGRDLVLQPPVLGVADNPLIGITPDQVRVVPVGTAIRELAPEHLGPIVCRLNGQWLLREHWGRLLGPADVLEFHALPQDKDTLRGVLQIVITVASIYVGGAWGAAIAIAGNLAVNALLPPSVLTPAEQQSASPTYSTSLSGNAARLDQPIPKICGRHRVVPPFAAQPYFEYDDKGDQYYYALLAVGIGNHTIERALIDDTDISRFADILVNHYLPPGTPPSTVLANVVTAPEVAGQDMLPAQYVGGFAACGPRLTARQIGVDVIAPRGLALATDDGALGDLSVSWRVEVRTVDDFGAALTPWSVLANETRTAHDNTPQRWSARYTLPAPARVEVRVVRTDLRNDSIRALHDITWSGLRAYLDQPAPLNADTAHYEIVMRASEQLSGLSQRQIALIAWGHARSWSPGGGWGAAAPTRNPAWWLADLWSSATWGEGLPDSRIDLPTLYALAQEWDQRQDRFDFVFDSAMSAWDAAQLIARAGRARVFRRNGVLTLARDGAAELPVTAFTPRNTLPGTMAMSEALPTRETPDGVVVEYFDNRAWDWIEVECPCPGVADMVAPVRKRIPGITGRIHAEREGRYEAATMLYRRRRAKCTTELQGMLPAYLSPVRWQPEIAGYGQSGDVAFWDPATLVMGLTEQPAFTGSDYLTLIRDDGSLTTPVAVTPGPTAWDVILPAAPDFELVLDDANRERPKFLFGPLDTGSELVRISAITDGGTSEDGAPLIALEAVVDDARVHTADAALLPGPGDIQDPVDVASDVGDGGGDSDEAIYVVRLTSTGAYASVWDYPPARATYTLNSDGTASSSDMSGSAVITRGRPNEWMQFGAVEPSVAARYEVLASLQSGDAPSGDALDEWLNLGTTRSWYVETAGYALCYLRVQIREAVSGIVQAEQTISLNAVVNYGGGA